MTTVERLLRLYPRAWRERYGDEFLAVVGESGMGVQQTIDIVSGAIDAWLSSDVRNATRVSSAATSGEVTMTVRTMVCAKANYTTRDGLIGAGVMIAGSLLFAILGMVLKQNGWPEAAEAILANGWLVSLTLSMPFWLMKGQPRRAQIVIVGGTLVLLLAIAALNFG